MPPGRRPDTGWEEYHEPVMIAEVLHYLEPKDGEVMIDCTLGTGGHGEEIAKRIGSNGLLLGIDRDEEALEIAARRLSAFSSVRIYKWNYSELKALLEKEGVPAVDGVLFDLGVSSYQLSRPERGFSFSLDGPLDMRMDKDERLTAEEIVNRFPEKNLRCILRKFGEERHAGRITRAILRERKKERITGTRKLAELVARNVPPQKKRRIHPATRAFQALRVAVNRELECLEKALSQVYGVLREGGRLVAVSFHSLEDRIVKNSLKLERERGRMVILTKRCITPSWEEKERNPRSRSARLRAGMKGHP